MTPFSFSLCLIHNYAMSIVVANFHKVLILITLSVTWKFYDKEWNYKYFHNQAGGLTAHFSYLYLWKCVNCTFNSLLQVLCYQFYLLCYTQESRKHNETCMYWSIHVGVISVQMKTLSTCVWFRLVHSTFYSSLEILWKWIW